MKLVELKCKNCGAILEVDEGVKDITCKYCRASFKLDDEVQHIQYDNMHESGYEFEKGRIQAQNEEKERINEEIRLENEEKIRQENKKKNLKWWIIGWILFFPIPLTILIWKSNWDKKRKIIITIVMWGILLLIGLFNNNETTNISNNSNVSSTTQNNENTINIPVCYEYDTSINLLINKYNENYDPDITSDMISKKHINGRDRDDVVNIFNNEKLEVIYYGNNKYNNEYSMSVFIGYKNETRYTNEDFKNEFIKYIQLFDENLSENEINTYWDDMISEYRTSYKINNIDISSNIINGKVEYFKITSKISFE